MATLSLERLIGATTDLPTIPQTLSAFQVAVSDPAVSLARVTEIIEGDPAIAAMVLRLANSPLRASRSTIGSIQEACTFLGTRCVSQLVLQATVLDMYAAAAEAEGFDPSKLWEHSLKTGLAARLLCQAARETFPLHPEEAYTQGLIHDVGKIVLLQSCPARLGRAVRASQQHGIPLYRAEEEVFGFTHAHVGGLLAQRWNLRSSVTVAITYHHDPDGLRRTCSQESLLHAANRIAHEAEEDGPEWAPGPAASEGLRIHGIPDETLREIREAVREFVAHC